ncbi:DUF4442 domain-containing protein [Flavivirga spongiicola]|uniref:DUF4442 domain-containing protein n=1 Tax=Flavivirga spongiicola TaxID=421621 RepID=A0ABU7XTK6_9FLAO|nr:DUF4442 domain-containing protein [Flavivirga sp. MEBiC05379]MDO5978764.1 YiiD C-terminal domain-containing protein [Flavivirga sp. MEBiC05379]
MYRTLTKILKTFLTDAQIYKYGFNWSPMYRRTTGKIIEVSSNLSYVKITIPLSIKNKNYVGSIFGGSLFSATDPIYMIQLLNILGDDYVVWDKDATIKYKRPAKENVYAEFSFSSQEIENIKTQVAENGEFNLTKMANITNKENVVFAEVVKTIYVADKTFYKEKRKLKAIKK